MAECPQSCRDFDFTQLVFNGKENLFVTSADQRSVEREFFGHLFTRAQAREFDFYVTFRVFFIAQSIARTFDNLLRELFDLNRFSHVEHKDFTAFGHRTRAQHQMHAS